MATSQWWLPSERGCRRGQLFAAIVWELRAAEDFLAHVPGADMVKFAKNGSDTTTAAIKLARAATGRDLVAICGTQPFFSVDDWFIASTQMKAGIPSAYGSMTVKFNYNDLPSVQALFDAYPDQIAAVILEAATATAEPAPGFLEGLRSVTEQHGAVLIFDEMITGMRWSRHGAQRCTGSRPICRRGERQSATASLCRRWPAERELMEAVGSTPMHHERSFVHTRMAPKPLVWQPISRCPSAYAERDVVARDGDSRHYSCGPDLSRLPRRRHVGARFLPGPSLCLVFATKDHNGQPSQAFRTLFIQELLRRGVLGQSLVISAAHTDADIDQTIEAAAGALEVYARAQSRRGSTDGLLVGRPVAPGATRVCRAATTAASRDATEGAVEMKVVLFCGGLGMRMRSGSDTPVPKPMMPIGTRPVLWHIMRYYAHFGHNEFILCLGFGAHAVKDYFLDYHETHSNDFVLSNAGRTVELLSSDISDWRITFADTGFETPIGERLRRVRDYLGDDEVFLANYGDVSDQRTDERPHR